MNGERKQFGLISDPRDPHTLSIQKQLSELGHDPLIIDSSGSGKFSFLEGTWKYNGQTLDEIKVFYFRNMLSQTPAVRQEGGEYKLYRDWYTQFMHIREIYGVQLSWIYGLQAAGKILVNPPTPSVVGVLKPHQLYVLQKAGFPVPASVITRNPEEARAFIQSKEKVIYKPASGGAFAELVDEKAVQRLDAIQSHYVIFQEFVEGTDIRVTAAEDEILAAAELESQAVDFRATPGYLKNKIAVSPCEIPDEIVNLCFKGLKLLGLYYSGIDLKRTREGKYVFLEFNLHPAFLWIEQKLKKPISRGIANLLVKLSA
ncbi:MAG: ATP-grasp domain-containing protein [Candidatus Eremiobacteraeota bacterium]|nr:ATP-grasp domain-containing protein [Candidatus Eremiobacteraeota bacterium]